MRTPHGGLTRGAPRLVRGAAAGLSTGVLAVFAHSAAGGPLPDWHAIAVPVAAVTVVAVGLARLRMHPATLLALLGLGQFAVHCVLSLGAGHTGTAHADPLRSGTLGGALPDVVTPVMTPMAAAHVAATLVVFAGLAGAEHVLFRLLDAVAARLPRPSAPLAVTGPVWTPRPPDPPHRVTLAVLCTRVHGRRGPP